MQTAAGMRVTYGADTGRPERIAHVKNAAELARFDYGFDPRIGPAETAGRSIRVN